jgi:hypothetical protein
LVDRALLNALSVAATPIAAAIASASGEVGAIAGIAVAIGAEAEDVDEVEGESDHEGDHDPVVTEEARERTAQCALEIFDRTHAGKIATDMLKKR